MNEVDVAGPGLAGLPRESASGRDGFILALVVFMLFAIGVAAAAGYQMVSTEFSMAVYARDGQKALTIARAGLNRFLAEQAGVMPTTITYPIGAGDAVITVRKVYEKDARNHLYYIRSEGRVDDPRSAADPTTRVVTTYAWHRIRPLRPKAAIVAAINELEVENYGVVWGQDASTSSDCAAGGVSRAAAVVLGFIDVNSYGWVGGTPAQVVYPDFGAVYDTVGLRWDVLSDPDYPVDFVGNDGIPPFASLPADSFPVTRYLGDLNAGNEWDGRGVLVVTGRFDAQSSFDWRGIILAGELDDRLAPGSILGTVVGGLNGTQTGSKVEWHGYTRYHGCNVDKAAMALSYLDAVPDAIVELR